MSPQQDDLDWNEEDRDESRVAIWWVRIKKLLARLRTRYLLFFPILAFFLAIRVGIYLFATPIYTATAVIGPPNPSPIASMIAGLNGTSGLAGAARRLVGGSNESGNDPFQEYLQLLQSSRLAEELAVKDKILPIIFYKRWDAEHKRWYPPGALSNLIAAVKRVLNQPVQQYPDADLLAKYLSKNFSMAQTTTGRGLSSLMGPSYMSVSIQYKDPREAERLLKIILARADEIIRQEQLSDVLARISYISTELPNVAQAEQKQALIETLSGQEQLKMMLVADKRFASTLVDLPHSGPKPTSPVSFGPALIYALLLSFLTWIALVALELKSRFIARALKPFNRSPYWPLHRADSYP